MANVATALFDVKVMLEAPRCSPALLRRLWIYFNKHDLSVLSHSLVAFQTLIQLFMISYLSQWTQGKDRMVALGASYERYMINWTQGHPLGRRFELCSKDYRIEEGEVLSTFSALQYRKIPGKLLLFVDESYWVPKTVNMLRWYYEVLDWLLDHVQV
ncbi:hypothetical protein SPOG_01663 [Schizosaccharomyces cryophilus OY26]|uniref:Uncharacterized protein n=1 Tax=Schizosaccharomyces cryophilus (strain OY26 / ATCC MYA-4695 / CBS 11777 / NBRC 106824 / NRRL Y48691) TaxID=653667 RepID=S9VXP7_SCHCR|nr:uncharacterized protein SPOG_01663 [Schizosaccharomyces cryophilus OY26]EPY52338.1 hypothetical protein SPOG_01663 [Schizosaccharomyces cryophilus OY26]